VNNKVMRVLVPLVITYEQLDEPVDVGSPQSLPPHNGDVPEFLTR